MSTADKKASLIKRLNYLWRGELAAVFYFPLTVLLLGYAFDRGSKLPEWLGYAIAAFMLLQGAAYWRIKLEATKQDAEIPLARLQPFVYFRPLNWLLLVVWWITVLLTMPYELFHWIIGLFFWLLGLLEQINYYYYQLMYDFSADFQQLRQTKRLRKPSLRRQLERLQ